MRIIFVGIDNGKYGGIGWINKDGKILNKEKTPIIKGTKKGSRDEYDIVAMKTLLHKTPPGTRLFITIEKGAPLPPGMGGGIAQFNRGYSYGLWLGMVTALQIPFQVVRAITWQKEMLKDINTKDRKQASIIAAKRLWPGENFKRTEKCKKDDDGLTDACLIAEYSRKMYKKEM